jgi:hypothetical protein
MRLTVEQRLLELERNGTVCHDTVKLFHKLLKEQRQLINDYILMKARFGNSENRNNGGKNRSEEEIYSFICAKRFDHIEREIKRILKTLEHLKSEFEAARMQQCIAK